MSRHKALDGQLSITDIERIAFRVRQCIMATVTIYNDGRIHCPVIECYGCQYCYERLDYMINRDDRQNYDVIWVFNGFVFKKKIRFV